MSIDFSSTEAAGDPPAGDTAFDVLTVAVSRHGPHDVITVHGEIDLATETVLRAAINTLLDAGRAQLVIDLDRVDFIDSTGLGVLLEAHRRTIEQGGALTLVCHGLLCTRLFEVSGLDRVLTFTETVEAALTPDSA